MLVLSDGTFTQTSDVPFTFQTSTYLNKDSELQGAGLLGPVQVLSYDYKMVK